MNAKYSSRNIPKLLVWLRQNRQRSQSLLNPSANRIIEYCINPLPRDCTPIHGGCLDCSAAPTEFTRTLQAFLAQFFTGRGVFEYILDSGGKSLIILRRNQ